MCVTLLLLVAQSAAACERQSVTAVPTHCHHDWPKSSMLHSMPALHHSLLDPTHLGGELAAHRNHWDFDVNAGALEHMIREVVMPHCGCFTLVTGGLRDGDLVAPFVKSCPSITVLGFEVVRKFADMNKDRFANASNVHIFNCGMGDQDRALVPVFGESALAGFHQSGSWADEKVQSGTAAEVALASFVPLHGIHRVSYLTIDTEGHEAPVFVGLGLDNEHNVRRFPAFQFEVGGTWNDGRHNPRWWTLPQAVQHLLAREVTNST